MEPDELKRLLDTYRPRHEQLEEIAQVGLDTLTAVTAGRDADGDAARFSRMFFEWLRERRQDQIEAVASILSRESLADADVVLSVFASLIGLVSKRLPETYRDAVWAWALQFIYRVAQTSA